MLWRLDDSYALARGLGKHFDANGNYIAGRNTSKVEGMSHFDQREQRRMQMLREESMQRVSAEQQNML